MAMGSGLPGGTRLWGRERECRALDELVASVRRGESRSLVLRGEAGIGKTALLEYLVQTAADLNIVRATGIESEMELAFAGLHQLCAPLLDRLEQLPAPHATRSEPSSARPQDFLRTDFWSGSLRSACSPTRPSNVPCCASWTTRNGWIRRRR